MFHKYFLVPALVAFAGLFMGSETAMAQRGRGSRGGGGHAAVSHSSTVHRGGAVTRGGYRDGGRGYGRGYGGYGGAYGWWPGAYGYGYWPDYSYGPAYDGSPAYSDNGFPVVPYATQPVSTAADIRVIVPDPSARVWFDGNPTRQTGTDRLFHSAPLATTGTYHIKATWLEDGRPVTQERDVAVSPGQAVTVDFAQKAVSTPH